MSLKEEGQGREVGNPWLRPRPANQEKDTSRASINDVLKNFGVWTPMITQLISPVAHFYTPPPLSADVIDGSP